MISTRSSENQTWVDLNSPTKEEVDSLVLTRNIPPIVAKDLLTPTPRQYAEDSNNFIYAVLHIPAFKHSHAIDKEDRGQEIDCLISKEELITCRYDSIDALHYFAKQIEVNEILRKVEQEHLFFSMIREIYKSIINELAYTEDWMREIERNIFEGREKEMVFAISAASRNLINFRRIVDPHGRVFEILRDLGREKFGPQFEKSAKELVEEWHRLMRMVNNQIELSTELRETNNSLLSTKQNEIMKNLTILAFVVVPLAVVSQIFGMNTINNPVVGLPYDFWIVIGVMLTMTLAMYAFFKYKKWI